MKKTYGVLLRMILSLVIGFPVFAMDIRLICPYAGPITDVYRNDDRKLNLEDTKLLKGLFFQWINPQRFQWNAFVYQSSDINYSTLWGGHFIFDRYFCADERGKWVVGGGVEYLRIDMKAGGNIKPMTDFRLLNSLFIPYARFGYRFQFHPGGLTVGMLPWVGAEYQGVRGDLNLEVDPPGPAPAVTTSESIDGDDFFGIAGLNVNANLFHMLELEAKYHGAFNASVKYSSASAMVNLFVTRRCGFSYRVKYMELDKGWDLYHIFGIAIII
ncbi:MAG TPA: hypothetical protein VGB38_08425 [bacterium]